MKPSLHRPSKITQTHFLTFQIKTIRRYDTLQGLIVGRLSANRKQTHQGAAGSRPVPAQRQAATFPPPKALTNEDWEDIANSIPPSQAKSGFVVKDQQSLEQGTNCKHFKGFAFLGNSAVEVRTNQGTVAVILQITFRNCSNRVIASVPTYLKRKSRNEGRKVFYEGTLPSLGMQVHDFR